MLTINHLTIRLFGCEFKVPEKYFNGYIFCCRTGRVCVSIGEPVRENGGWNIEGYEHATLGKIPTFFTEEQVIKSVAPVKSYLVGGKGGDSWEALCEFTRKHHEAKAVESLHPLRGCVISTAKELTIRVFGCEFKASEEYLDGYVFCMSNGNVFVSDKKPVREATCWDLRGIKFKTVGYLPHQLTSEEATKSVRPLRDYYVFGDIETYAESLCESIKKGYAIEEGRLYTWGTGQSVYLRANKRLYLVEPHSGSLVDLGPSYEHQRLIAYYSGFRYVSSWGAGNDKSSE